MLPCLPDFYDVRQTFQAPEIDDISAAVDAELQKLNVDDLRPGQTIAITAGSRGIANIVTILQRCVSRFKAAHTEPFLVPAMGSHGGATVEGQLEVLAELGITEAAIGCEIRASMDTVVVAESGLGLPVHFDRCAAEADHVFVVGRIKPHTRFAGPIESGLHKMLLIGLGKHQGAAVYHQAIQSWTFQQIIDDVTPHVLNHCSIWAGLAIVENAIDQTALIEAVSPEHFAKREPELLQKAKQWLPSLPCPEIDLLIVDRIGKNISGVGMDANIVGRKFNDHAATHQDSVSCKRILVRSLTNQTKGNATGIGMAEFTTERCVAQIDHKKTAINCVTSSHPEAGMLPLIFPSDKSAIEAALKTIGNVRANDAKIIQIQDTLHLEKLKVSQACLNHLSDQAQAVSSLKPLQFTTTGELADIS